MGLAAAIALIAVAVGGVVIYNGLARLRLLADGAWADIDVQLKRRHDLIPNLVAAVQGHAGYERATLESVIAARNRAIGAANPRASGEAEGLLAGAVRQIFALAEAYPDLKATDSFLALQRNLSEIEDHVQQARRYYNAVVRDLNTRVAQFPSNLVASAFRIGPREFFGLANAAEGVAPTIDLGRRR
jgi:LemA protein